MNANVNRIKIDHNPYKKTFSYYLWNTERCQYDSLGDKEGFNKYYKFGNIPVKAFDIIDKINKDYNKNDHRHSIDKTEIVFSGTKEDEEYLRKVIEKEFCDVSPKLCVVRDNVGYYSPGEVKSKIDTIFKNIENEINSHIQNDINDIENYKKVSNPAVPICVIGTYSAGKSSFINSLLGFELLPSAGKRLTSRIYKISTSCENTVNKISYQINDEHRSIKFEVSEKNKMYNLVKYLNSNDDKSISETIEIILSADSLFKNSPLDFKNHNYVIYDTPGSNSETSKDHLETLKRALKNQTDGLLILVTKYGQIDTKDTKTLINEVNKNIYNGSFTVRDSMDMHNILVVLNGADEIGRTDLEETKKNCKNATINSLIPAGYYLVSSAMGLGFKKSEPEFIDETLDEVYDKNLNNFSDSNRKHYTQLYKYNFMPKYEYDNYRTKAENYDEDKRVYYNSGLHCLETAIRNFADRSAVQIKCRNSSIILEKVLCKCQNTITNKQNNLETYNKDLRNKLDAKYKNLLSDIDNKGKEMIATHLNGFKQIVENDTQNTTSQISGNLSLLLSRLKSNKNEIDICTRLSEQFTRDLTEYCDKIYNKANDFWYNVGEAYKEKSVKIITDSNELDENDKRFLKEKIMKLETRNLHHFNYKPDNQINIRKGFLIFKRLNRGDISYDYNHKARNELTKINHNVAYSSNDAFKKLKADLQNVFRELAEKYNPEIEKLNENIKECETSKEKVTNEYNKINDALKTIKSLLEPKKWSD